MPIATPADMSSSTAHADASAPTWQCVLICWGTRYDTALINNLVRSISAQSSQVPRFVLISDRERPDLLDGVQLVRFPARWLDEPLRRSGCQAKLVMFEKGIVPEDLPALYVDLDTIVLGDLARAQTLMSAPQDVAILKSAILTFGPIGRALHRWTNGKRYARGNSSFVVYHPAHCHFIAERFMALYAQHPNFEFRPMVADERFISWVAQPHMRRIPASFAVKFPGEYMFYWGWWLYVKARLPWVRSRRAGLAAVTLNGLMIKPERLLTMQEGETLVDEKSRKLIWSRKTLGAMQAKIRSYYAQVL
ncbi:MAG: hypothetical protein RJA98_1183 [Pseudomonadota bacterium]|jgi:hypothetical protein